MKTKKVYLFPNIYRGYSESQMASSSCGSLPTLLVEKKRIVLHNVMEDVLET